MAEGMQDKPVPSEMIPQSSQPEVTVKITSAPQSIQVAFQSASSSQVEKGEDIYAKARIERQKFVDAVLSSKARKKIVVAGPGTGKTFLFRKVLEAKNNTLTLTFINALVEDLSLELCGLSEVRTLHGFARTQLARLTNQQVSVFPLLSEVIKKDAEMLLGENVDFDRIFHDRDDTNKHVGFYVSRRRFYDHYGYSDIVFEIVQRFETDRSNVPGYEQVVVDEFQDFNKLEVSLIELLAEKSPMLLAGDDDQALYDFKRASTEYIRKMHAGGESGSDYEPFNLPYCSRCTKVVVDAANDLISAANAKGYLDGRIQKPYLYFVDPQKDKESRRYATIAHTSLYSGQIPWFIEKQLDEIAHDEKRMFSVLIISPTKIQMHTLVKALKKKGLQNISCSEKREHNGVSLLDGLKLLLEDKTSNLGWRIVAERILEQTEFEKLLKDSNQVGAEPIIKLIADSHRETVKQMLRVLRTIRDDKSIDGEKLMELAAKVGFDPHEATKEAIKDEITSSLQRTGKSSIRKIPIKATTIQGSKGLAADYVFITHFDDQYFVKNKDKTRISHQDICNSLVALTRAKRKVFLISSNARKTPTFLTWIQNGRIEKI